MINFFNYHTGTLDHDEYRDSLSKFCHPWGTNEKRYRDIEHIIKKDASAAASYALEFMGGRWREAEPYIIKDSASAYIYARTVLKNIWPEAEPNIMSSSQSAYYYARFVIKSRWIEAERVISKDPFWWEQYCRRFFIQYGYNYDELF